MIGVLVIRVPLHSDQINIKGTKYIYKKQSIKDKIDDN